MGAIKLSQFPHDQIRKSELARAVSVPARITILRMILSQGYVDGNLLQTQLDLAPSTIHHHLTVLKSSRLIIGDFMGNNYFWSMNYDCESEIKALSWFWEDIE